MIGNNKFIFLLAACLLFSGLFGIGNQNDPVFKGGLCTALAAEEENKAAPDKGDPAGETPCPECPECPDSAKVVLSGL